MGGAAIRVLLATSVVACQGTASHVGVCPRSAPDSYGDVTTWNLPTGSQIAVRVFPASRRDDRKRPPVVLLHGGPGAGQLSEACASDTYYRTLADDGFDVVVYDQAGSGLSARLADPREYTVDRHVADLEAIRVRLGVGRVILVGHSWGAVLAVHYMALHGAHVARAVLAAPGTLDPALGVGVDFERLPRANVERHRALTSAPRVRAVEELVERGDVARAYRFLSETELDAWSDEFIATILPGTVCDPVRAPTWPGGAGWWAWMMTNLDVARRARLLPGSIATEIQVLVLRGECDYVPDTALAEYRRLLPAATYMTIEGAGHLIHVERPDVYTRDVRAFLDAEHQQQ